jgi:hypothetical protein
VISEAFVLAGTYLVFRRGVGVRVAFLRPLVRPVFAGGVVIAVFRLWLWFPRAGAPLTLLLGIGVTGLYVGVLALSKGLPPDLSVFGRRALNVVLRREL